MREPLATGVHANASEMGWILNLRGYGVDGYVWQTTNDNILKVARNRAPFRRASRLALAL
jgi:hypothetical protein